LEVFTLFRISFTLDELHRKKMDEENPTCAGLTQEIGFGSA
jgi:hypothetical protein